MIFVVPSSIGKRHKAILVKRTCASEKSAKGDEMKEEQSLDEGLRCRGCRDARFSMPSTGGRMDGDKRHDSGGWAISEDLVVHGLETGGRNKWGNIEATRKALPMFSRNYFKDVSTSNKAETRDNQTCDHPNDDIENDEQDTSLNSPNMN